MSAFINLELDGYSQHADIDVLDMDHDGPHTDAVSTRVSVEADGSVTVQVVVQDYHQGPVTAVLVGGVAVRLNGQDIR